MVWGTGHLCTYRVLKRLRMGCRAGRMAPVTKYTSTKRVLCHMSRSSCDFLSPSPKEDVQSMSMPRVIQGICVMRYLLAGVFPVLLTPQLLHPCRLLLVILDPGVLPLKLCMHPAGTRHTCELGCSS